MTRAPGLARPLKAYRGIVFVVDDDEDLLRLAVQLLEANNYLVYSARRGEDALLRMRGIVWGPAVAVIDLMMPDMTGPELVSAMKADQNLAGIPVILCTAISNPAPVEGVELVIEKPYDRQRLLAAVERSLK